MNQIAQMRLQVQQLVNPQFNTPKELVSWMGAIQAQDITMAKWAVGIRLKNAKQETVNDALRKGEILRIHVMRPTWHYISSEDARWMIKLSSERVRAANASYARGLGLEISGQLLSKSYKLLEKILEGNRHLTKQEIEEEFQKADFPVHERYVHRLMEYAETESIVCSGTEKGNKHTYALLDERVPPAKELHRDEALALLALRYFQSHSPASFSDFLWWSGLTTGDARKAISFIKHELITERINDQEYFIHESCRAANDTPTLHLLPPFDEYLISYKDRSAVLTAEHQPKAHNRWGIFYPVIAHNGQIAGNWNKTTKKKETQLETSFFEPKLKVNQSLLKEASAKYQSFIL